MGKLEGRIRHVVSAQIWYIPCHSCYEYFRPKVSLYHIHIVPGKHSSSPKYWGWAVTRRRSLINYPRAVVHPRCGVSSRGTTSTCIVTSSVIRQSQPDSRKGCIVLQSGPTCSFIAKFPLCLVVACSTQILCCRGRMLWTRPWKGVCEPLMSDGMAHQNNCSYVSSVDLPSDSPHKF